MAKLPTKYIRTTSTGKIPLADQAFIFSTMVDLLKMGISLRKSVDFIRIMRPSIAKPMQNVIEQLQRGQSFSAAFQPYVSTNIYYQLAIADQHGGLVRTLNTIAQIFTSQEQQRKKLRSVIQYPLFLLLFLGLMMVGMRIYIMPELADWNRGTKSWDSQLIKAGWVAVFLVALAALGYYFWKFKRSSITNQVNLLCRLPIIGPLYQNYCHYYLLANLSFLIANGMSVGSICKYLNQLDSKSLLHQIGRKVEHSIANGRQVDQIIQKAVYLPTELSLLIQKGSQKDALATEIYALSMMKYKSLIIRIERLILVVQPILFGIIGIVIVIMYWNLLMPMYNSIKEVS